MKGIARDCLVEFMDRKALWIFVAAILFGIFIVFVTRSIETHVTIESSGTMNLGDISEAFGNPILRAYNSFVSFIVFLAVLASVGLFPRMLERGRVDFYLSKPLSRASLLLNKLLGIFLVYGGAVVASGLVIYLAIGVVHGVFNLSLIYLLLMSLVSFFVWLSITCCFGVMSGSPVMAIMAAFILWAAQKVLAAREVIKAFLDSRIVDYALDFTYYVVPKTSAISDLFIALASGREVSDWMPLWSSLLTSAVLVFVAVWVLKRKDF